MSGACAGARQAQPPVCWPAVELACQKPVTSRSSQPDGSRPAPFTCSYCAAAAAGAGGSRHCCAAVCPGTALREWLLVAGGLVAAAPANWDVACCLCMRADSNPPLLCPLPLADEPPRLGCRLHHRPAPLRRHPAAPTAPAAAVHHAVGTLAWLLPDVHQLVHCAYPAGTSLQSSLLPVPMLLPPSTSPPRRCGPWARSCWA